ncbi:hypothetical protein HYT23_05310 [Candidatus Pacearchaeota archaeon]|nr:hypothetical protein [Candidatus Pacearchaeota archaeon]
MGNQTINSILNNVLNKINPSKKETAEIKEIVDNFTKKIELRMRKVKLKAEVFVGGSFAKNTMIKKDKYDIDLFLRFWENGSLSDLTHDILDGICDFEMVHGSRDYFRVKVKENIYLEVVPVKKVNNPKDSENITDLSYSHVKYINKRVKDKKILDEIRLAKAFCYATRCYGAESYINGFSGYSLELLVYYYGGFVKFLKGMIKASLGKKKIIIDMEKQHKSGKNISLDLNSAKLVSPVVLIDPTYKHRNALAALSNETFRRFISEAEKFLKKPSEEAFELRRTNIEAIKAKALKKKQEFLLLEACTNKQVGDIAGSKLLKFYRHLTHEISKYFNIKDKGFNYSNNQNARYYFVLNSKEEIIVDGPDAGDKTNLLKFRKKHKNIFINKGKVYARESINYGIKRFVENWKNNNSRKIKEMYITKLEIV